MSRIVDKHALPSGKNLADPKNEPHARSISRWLCASNIIHNSEACKQPYLRKNENTSVLPVK